MLNEISPSGKNNSDFARVSDENSAESSGEEEDDQMLLLVDFAILDELYFDVEQPTFQSPDESTKKERQTAILPSSLTLLKSFASRFSRLKQGGKMNSRGKITESNNTKANDTKKFSTDAILRLAGHKFIESFSQTDCSSFLGLEEQDRRDVELVGYLLAAAEKVEQGDYDSAEKLLGKCDELSYVQGNSVQRLVYYFSQSLREKIVRSTLFFAEKGWRKKHDDQEDLEEALKSIGPCIYAFHEKVPLAQVSQFTSIQTVIEHVADARKIHIIDLEIRSGVQWAILMQSVASNREFPFEHLKITALEGTKYQSKIEETGMRLRSFAESLNLSFSFNVVAIEDVVNGNESKESILSRFQLDGEEAVAVYAHCFFTTMVSKQEKMESLMRVIRSLNPRVMFVMEVEASLNSLGFVNRFIEALFFYGTIFDSLEDCMKDDEQNRTMMEAKHFSRAIRNVVAAEEENRMIRHVRMKVWRGFFVRFGMEEMELSMPSVYQATLLLKRFDCGSSCTLDMDEKALIIGWKGTPLASLSAWKFL